MYDGWKYYPGARSSSTLMKLMACMEHRHSPQQGGSKGPDTDILHSRYRGQASLEYKRRFRIQTTKSPRCILSRTVHFLSSISTACIPWRPFSGDWMVRYSSTGSLYFWLHTCVSVLLKFYRGIKAIFGGINGGEGGFCCWKSFASASTPHGGECDSLCVAVGVQKKVTASAEGGQMSNLAKTQLSDLYSCDKGGNDDPFRL
jgi:hypothetical protein